MRAVAVTSHKGGAGKTSTAVLLAEELAERGLRVLLIDADRYRSAGLLMGVQEGSARMQTTRRMNLRYFCSSQLTPADLPSHIPYLEAWVDIAVIDTPPLDDPLAQAWIRLSSAVLLVMSMEAISVRTLPRALAELASIRRERPGLKIIGVQPTLFAASDAIQRSLLQQLRVEQGTLLIEPPIPFDLAVTQAGADGARRSAFGEETARAYRTLADRLLQFPELSPPRRPRPEPAEEPASVTRAPVVEDKPGRWDFLPELPWRVAPVAPPVVAGLMLISLGLGLFMGWTMGTRAVAGQAGAASALVRPADATVRR